MGILFFPLGMVSRLTVRKLVSLELSLSILYSSLLLTVSHAAAPGTEFVPIAFAGVQGLGIALWTLKEAELAVERAW